MPKNKTHSGMKKRVKVTGTRQARPPGIRQASQPGEQADQRTRRWTAQESPQVDVPRVKPHARHLSFSTLRRFDRPRICPSACDQQHVAGYRSRKSGVPWQE